MILAVLPVWVLQKHFADRNWLHLYVQMVVAPNSDEAGVQLADSRPLENLAHQQAKVQDCVCLHFPMSYCML